MQNKTKWIMSLIILFVLILVSIINQQGVMLNLIVTTRSLSLFMVIWISIIIGMLWASVFWLETVWTKRKELKKLKQNIENSDGNSVSINQEEIEHLHKQLQEKELELSELRHQLVTQVMSNESIEPVDESSNIN